jgi:TRAP-type transport system periplasmic protein
MTRSAEPASRAAWEYLQKNALKEFPGTKILATWVHDEGFLHTRDKQVKVAADLKGLKLRAPTRLTNKLLASLGASPVGMPMPATADALSKGTIDGMLFPWEIIPALRFQELVKYHAETDPTRGALYSANFIFAMNQAKYDSLPADLKAIIDRNSGAAYSQAMGKIWDESAVVGKKSAMDRGNTIYTIPAAEVDNWVKVTAPLYDEWIADMGKRNLNGKQLLDDARALIAQHTKK